jgi:ArsR family transcriptional regulator
MTSPKSQVFEQFADLARVLGHANRLELLEYVAQGERSVDRLAQLAGLSVASESSRSK